LVPFIAFENGHCTEFSFKTHISNKILLSAYLEITDAFQAGHRFIRLNTNILIVLTYSW